MNVKLTVVGNCGRTHPLFEDWQRCKACETPSPSDQYRDLALAWAGDPPNPAIIEAAIHILTEWTDEQADDVRAETIAGLIAV